MSELVDTTEMYLKSIYELLEDGIVPLRARIVERLGHSGPTVSQTIARMERDGLLEVEGNRQIVLTESGMRHATDVIRKHRLAECLLTEVIGMSWAEVHEEACRWEHVMGDKVESLLEALLQEPQTDPYGNPMPKKMSQLSDFSPQTEGISLDQYSKLYSPGEVVEISRIGEPMQAVPGVLEELFAANLLPGSKATLRFVSDGAAVEISNVSPVQGGKEGSSVAVIPDIFFKHFFVKPQ